MQLAARWQRVWQSAGLAVPDAEYQHLLARYSEPHRKYHTLQHLQECLLGFEKLRASVERPLEVELALWYHDAIYDPSAHDNELKSAEWARDTALAMGLASNSAELIFDLIMCTRHDAPPTDDNAAALVDIDLIILGSNPNRFDEYERQIRAEYAGVAEPSYREARRKIMQQFADRSVIYHTRHCYGLYELAARRNIARTLVQL